jgi:hypothetical protein
MFIVCRPELDFLKKGSPYMSGPVLGLDRDL